MNNSRHPCTFVRATPEVEVTSIGKGNIELFARKHGKGLVTQVCTVLNDDIMRR